MNKEQKNDEIKPIGIGTFGNIYDQFKGKAVDAFKFLIKHKEGDLLGVFYRDGFGYVDLVWGNENGGLKHILLKHVGEKKSFENVETAVCKIRNIIELGEIVFENVDKAVFQIDNRIVTVRNLKPKQDMIHTS